MVKDTGWWLQSQKLQRYLFSPLCNSMIDHCSIMLGCLQEPSGCNFRWKAGVWQEDKNETHSPLLYKNLTLLLQISVCIDCQVIQRFEAVIMNREVDSSTSTTSYHTVLRRLTCPAVKTVIPLNSQVCRFLLHSAFKPSINASFFDDSKNTVQTCHILVSDHAIRLCELEVGIL